MRYPLINKQQRRTVTIPDLVGGLNLRDGVSGILDNQLTDCKNVWHHNGLLRTRPNIKADVNNTTYIGRPLSNQEVRQTEHRDIRRNIDGKMYMLHSAVVIHPDINSCYITFWWQGKNNNIPLGTLLNDYYGYENYFVTEKDNAIYCFLYHDTIYRIDLETNNWELLTPDDLYAPLVAIGGTAVNGTSPNTGTGFEAYNIVSSRYRMKLSTVDKTRESNEMVYRLLTNIKLDEGSYFDGTTVKAEITWANGNVSEHSVTINYLGIGYESTPNPTDNLIMKADGLAVTFYESDGTTVKVLTASEFVEDNMTITAPCYKGDLSKVYCMEHCVWFGGAANGINGGSRLFLGGNAEHRSLMLWSALDNPLYFPENNYAYVGKNGEAITGFGKQDDMLVIFKENEVYYTRYVQNADITADNLINQTIIDYQAASVYFPIVQLHTEIGCNVPDSIQLCRNRLVWAHTSGNIYTLVSANQYNERNIYSLSAMIERGLSISENATSADWNGYYCLLCNDKLWLLSYDSYGYQYVSSYSKAEDAAIKIPWFMWDFPFIDKRYGFTVQTNPRICLVDDNLIITVLNDTEGAMTVNISAYTLNTANASTDDEILIADENTGDIVKSTYNFESIAQTKIFDFNGPSYRKNVDAVDIGLGNNGGVPIKVSFITDVGTEQEEVTPYGTVETEYNPDFINNYHLSPCIRNVGRFGIRLISDGVLAVDNLNLQYRLLGGAK